MSSEILSPETAYSILLLNASNPSFLGDDLVKTYLGIISESSELSYYTFRGLDWLTEIQGDMLVEGISKSISYSYDALHGLEQRLTETQKRKLQIATGQIKTEGK